MKCCMNYLFDLLVFCITRWSIMIHVGVVQDIGTAYSDLNTWPLGVIWLLKWVK